MQTLIVILILAATLAFGIRRMVRIGKGKTCCSCDGCTKCSLSANKECQDRPLHAQRQGGRASRRRKKTEKVKKIFSRKEKCVLLHRFSREEKQVL